MITLHRKSVKALLRLACQLCLVFAIYFAGENGYGQEFQVEGTIYTSHHKANGEQGKSESSEFKVEVNGCIWRVTVTPTNNTTVDFYQVSFDGTNLYVFRSMESSVARRLRNGEKVGANKGIGAVVRKEVSHDLFSDGAGKIWIAYASGCYFKKQQTNLIEVPFYQSGNIPYRLDQTVNRRAHWQMLTNMPALPSSVIYLTIDEKHTNAQYSVLSYTNYQGLELPMESLFSVFDFPKKGLNSDGAAKVNYLIVATKFLQPNNGQFLFPPKIPVLTAVADFRLSNSATRNPAKVYMVDSRFWNEDEARNLHISELTGKPLASSFKLRWLLLGFALVSLIFIVLKHKKWE